MMNAVRSPITKVLTFIVGFIAAFSLVRALSRSFNYYAGQSLGNMMNMGLAVFVGSVETFV